MYGYAEQVQILCDAGAKNCIPKKSRGRLHDTIASIQYQIVKSYSIRESDKDIRVTALPEGLSKNKFKERLDNLKTRKIIKSSFKEENGQYVIQFRKLCDMEKELGLDKVSLSKLETDQHGYTPLGLAIQNRHFAAAESLLKCGAEPFDNVENPSSVITSESAEVDQVSNDMKAVGSVVAVSDSGITLYSETLTYNFKEERLYFFLSSS